MTSRLLAALFGAVFLALSAFSGPASAQDEANRAFATWSLEVSAFTQDALAITNQVDEVFTIIADVNAGEIDTATGQARIAELKAVIDARVLEAQARAEMLSAGPSLMPPRLADVIPTIAQTPFRSIDAVIEFRDITFTFGEQFLAGEPVDGALVDSARLGVFQSYYLNFATSNTTARDGIQPNHPQHHLLNAIALNSRSTAFSFELARQAMGTPPTGLAPDDIAGALALNREDAVASLQRVEQQQQQMAELFTSRTPEELRSTPSQVATLLAMLETYTESAEAEARLTDHFQQVPDLIASIQQTDDWSTWDAWVSALGEMELEREASMTERQRLLAQ